MKIFVMIMMLIAQSSQAGWFERGKSLLIQKLGLESPAIAGLAPAVSTATLPSAELERERKLEHTTIGQYGLKRNPETRLWEREKPNTNEIEYFREISWSSSRFSDDLIVEKKNKMGKIERRIVLTHVSTNTTSSSAFEGMYLDKDTGMWRLKPIEKIGEAATGVVDVPEPSIKGELAISTSTSSAEVQGNGVANKSTLPPEAEASNEPLEPLVVEPARDRVSESTTSVENKPIKERGLWVKNFTQKTLTMTAQRPGMEDLDLGTLVAGMEVFLPAPQGNIVSLTFKGGWFFKRELQQRFENGSVAEVHSLAVRD